MWTIVKVLWGTVKNWGVWAVLVGAIFAGSYGIYKSQCWTVSNLKNRLEALKRENSNLQESLESCEFNSKIRSKYEEVLGFNPIINGEPLSIGEENKTVLYRY